MLLVNQLTGFGAFEEASAGGVTSLAFLTSTTSSDSNTITGSASIQAGDLLVLLDRSQSSGTVIPSDFTSMQNATVDSARMIISYKVATGSEASASLTGMASPGGKILAVFRANIAITMASHASGGAEGTSGNPSSQSVVASGGTPPLVVLGGYATFNGTVNPRTFTPAKDSEINITGDGGDEDLWLAWHIYNTSPLDTSIDMDDEGSLNTLASGYIQVS